MTPSNNIRKSKKIPKTNGYHQKKIYSKEIDISANSIETKKTLFSWELSLDSSTLEPTAYTHKKTMVNNQIGYLLLCSAILGFVLAIIILIFPHQISGLKRAVFGLRLEIYYSGAIFILILSCIILWSSKHAFVKNSFAWVVVGSVFTLLITFISGYIINLKTIGSIGFIYLIITLIVIESVLGTFSLILTLTSRYNFYSEL